MINESERRKRIRLCIFAYAYEVMSAPLISDAEFDKIAMSVDVRIDGGLQDFWKTHFHPWTGQWIHSHPNFDGIKKLHARWVNNFRR